MQWQKRELPIGERGKIEVWTYGQLDLRRYHGVFTNERLQDQASAGTWTARVLAIPDGLTGTGDSPREAVRCLLARYRDRLTLTTRVLPTVEAAGLSLQAAAEQPGEGASADTPQ